MLLGDRSNWATYGHGVGMESNLIIPSIAHIAYFVALLKIADFLQAGVEVSESLPVLERFFDITAL